MHIQLMDKISHEHIKIDWLYLKCFYQIKILILLHIWVVTKPWGHACLKLEIIIIFGTYRVHHSLIKLETAQKMFANFLVSKGTKIENL